MEREPSTHAGWRGPRNAATVSLMLLLLIALAPACGTLRNGRRWGEDATLLPSGERLGQAALDGVTDPWTWVPLGSAAAISICGWDENLVEWAREQHPVYGS